MGRHTASWVRAGEEVSSRTLCRCDPILRSTQVVDFPGWSSAAFNVYEEDVNMLDASWPSSVVQQDLTYEMEDQDMAFLVDETHSAPTSLAVSSSSRSRDIPMTVEVDGSVEMPSVEEAGIVEPLTLEEPPRLRINKRFINNIVKNTRSYNDRLPFSGLGLVPIPHKHTGGSECHDDTASRSHVTRLNFPGRSATKRTTRDRTGDDYHAPTNENVLSNLQHPSPNLAYQSTSSSRRKHKRRRRFVSRD